MSAKKSGGNFHYQRKAMERTEEGWSLLSTLIRQEMAVLPYGEPFMVADNCSDAWKAKDGGANPRSFSGKADTGLFGMVCSHEVCLKLINLYKSGERMYYPIALLDFMFTEVAGEDARIGLLYDISCNFEAHLKKRDVFLTEREKGHLKFDEINESARTDLVAWLHRHYKSTNLQLSVACKDLGKAEAAGWTEDRLRVQWAAQRMAQSKEGQADEAERREKRYEELGQMLVQSDEFILALTRLEEALKKDDAETAIREAETAKYLAEKREALKQKIAAKARELVGPNGNENELKSFCRVHQALDSGQEQSKREFGRLYFATGFE
ncbi:hypothetical protein I312_106488 [Cryptococcus bacillisporus CA1280]|uniref:uncharacterized protein n=1 Tax=Cryptococcus bacillisporus CA1280 TaxID=1296109 RepID=UPI003367EEB2